MTKGVIVTRPISKLHKNCVSIFYSFFISLNDFSNWTAGKIIDTKTGLYFARVPTFAFENTTVFNVCVILQLNIIIQDFYI